MRRPRILIIDDYPGIRCAIKKALGGSGFEVLTAKDGTEGLAMARAHCPDLILLDVRMPGMNGYEVCRALQESPLMSHIPVLMLSRLDGARRVCRGLNAGADDYIPKPFELEELNSRIKMLIRRSAIFTHTTAHRI